MTAYILGTEKHGFNTEVTPFSDNIWSAVIAATTPTELVVPVGKNIARVRNSGTCWVGTATFVLPAGGAFTERDVELLDGDQSDSGKLIDVKNVSSLWFNSTGAANNISVAFYE